MFAKAPRQIVAQMKIRIVFEDDTETMTRLEDLLPIETFMARHYFYPLLKNGPPEQVQRTVETAINRVRQEPWMAFDMIPYPPDIRGPVKHVEIQMWHSKFTADRSDLKLRFDRIIWRQ